MNSPTSWIVRMVDHFCGVVQNEWTLAPFRGREPQRRRFRPRLEALHRAPWSRAEPRGVVRLYRPRAEILFRFARTLALDSRTASDRFEPRRSSALDRPPQRKTN